LSWRFFSAEKKDGKGLLMEREWPEGRLLRSKDDSGAIGKTTRDGEAESSRGSWVGSLTKSGAGSRRDEVGSRASDRTGGKRLLASVAVAFKLGVEGRGRSPGGLGLRW